MKHGRIDQYDWVFFTIEGLMLTAFFAWAIWGIQ